MFEVCSWGRQGDWFCSNSENQRRRPTWQGLLAATLTRHVIYRLIPKSKSLRKVIKGTQPGWQWCSWYWWHRQIDGWNSQKEESGRGLCAFEKIHHVCQLWGDCSLVKDDLMMSEDAAPSNRYVSTSGIEAVKEKPPDTSNEGWMMGLEQLGWNASFIFWRLLATSCVFLVYGMVTFCFSRIWLCAQN